MQIIPIFKIKKATALCRPRMNLDNITSFCILKTVSQIQIRIQLTPNNNKERLQDVGFEPFNIWFNGGAKVALIKSFLCTKFHITIHECFYIDYIKFYLVFLVNIDL